MKEYLCRTGMFFGIAVLTASGLQGQSDGLLSWTPSTGQSSVGPFILAAGSINMWQDGECINGLHLEASTTEEWICDPQGPPQIQGSAGLTYCYADDCSFTFACGVWSYARAQLMIGGSYQDVDVEWADSDCSGFLDKSGGPHSWACGSGCGIGGCS